MLAVFDKLVAKSKRPCNLQILTQFVLSKMGSCPRISPPCILPRSPSTLVIWNSWLTPVTSKTLYFPENKAYYLYVDRGLLELHWFKQSYGSWFLGDYVCEDGRLYTATVVDPIFILLPVFEEARMKKEGDPGSSGSWIR